MPELEKVESVTEDLIDYHLRVGFDDPSLIERSNEERTVRGFTIAESNEASLKVLTSTEIESFSIRFEYDLVADIANRMSEDAAQKYVGEEPSEDSDQSIETTAAQNLLKEIDIEQRRNILYQLHDIINSPRVWSELEFLGEDTVSGFRVRGRLYPYDHDVSVWDYEKQLSHVVSPANRGQAFLLYTLNLMNEGHIGGLEEMASFTVSDS